MSLSTTCGSEPPSGSVSTIERSRERNPRIVYAAATGFRKDGAYRDRPSFDDVIQGESGLAALNGGAGGEPRYVPMAVCDKICGYVLASAIGMALFHRERTGEGQEVHVPMLETMVAFNLADHLWHGVLAEPEKGLGYPRMLTEHRRPFPTKDGHICILATTDLQSRHLFEAIDLPRTGRRRAVLDPGAAHRQYRRAL